MIKPYFLLSFITILTAFTHTNAMISQEINGSDQTEEIQIKEINAQNPEENLDLTLLFGKIEEEYGKLNIAHKDMLYEILSFLPINDVKTWRLLGKPIKNFLENEYSMEFKWKDKNEHPSIFRLTFKNITEIEKIAHNLGFNTLLKNMHEDFFLKKKTETITKEERLNNAKEKLLNAAKKIIEQLKEQNTLSDETNNDFSKYIELVKISPQFHETKEERYQRTDVAGLKDGCAKTFYGYGCFIGLIAPFLITILLFFKLKNWRSFTIPIGSSFIYLFVSIFNDGPRLINEGARRIEDSLSNEKKDAIAEFFRVLCCGCCCCCLREPQD